MNILSKRILTVPSGWFAKLASVAILVSCVDAKPTAPENTKRALEQGGVAGSLIVAPAGLPTFSWLAPLGSGTPSTVNFDALAAPVVEVCLWTAGVCVGAPVVRFSTLTGMSDEPLVVNTTLGQYEASWNLMSGALITRRTYRIRTIVQGSEVGSAFVDVVRGRWALTRSDGTIAPLQSATGLPIRLNLSRVPSGPSVDEIVSGDGGTVTLPGIAIVSFPARSFAAPQLVTVARTSVPDVQSLFEDVVASLFPGPRVAEEVRIVVGERNPGAESIVELTVPIAMRDGLAANPIVEMFADDVERNAEGSFRNLTPLIATYNAATNTVRATLLPHFFDAGDRTDGRLEAVLLLASRPSPPAPSLALSGGARTFNVCGTGLTSTVRQAVMSRRHPAFINADFKSLRFQFHKNGPPYFGAPKYDPFGLQLKNFHLGHDLRGVASVDAVTAIDAGKVIKLFRNNEPFGGSRVYVKHASGAISRYMHLTLESIPARIILGADVERGELLGLVGMTNGAAAPPVAPHLHVERLTAGGVNTDPASCTEGLWPLAVGDVTVHTGENYLNGSLDFTSSRTQTVRSVSQDGQTYEVQSVRRVPGLNNVVTTSSVQNRRVVTVPGSLSAGIFFKTVSTAGGVVVNGTMSYVYPLFNQSPRDEPSLNAPLPSNTSEAGFALVGAKVDFSEEYPLRSRVRVSVQMTDGTVYQSAHYRRERNGIREDEYWNPTVGLVRREQYRDLGNQNWQIQSTLTLRSFTPALGTGDPVVIF